MILEPRHRRVCSVSSLVALAICSQTVSAQQALFATDAAPLVLPRGVNPLSRSDDAVVIIAPAKLVSGDPKSFQVVSIDVPEGLPSDRAIQYEVLQNNSSVLLSSTRGTIQIDGSRQRSILVTLQVPAAARAGSLSLAKVRFTADGENTIEVPIELSVAKAGRVEVTSLEGTRAARVGETFTLNYRVTNLRNTSENIEIQTIAPSGWRVRQVAPKFSLSVNGVSDRALTVSIPHESNTGGASIRVLALTAGSPVATVEIPVHVLGANASNNFGGPVLTTAAGFGSDNRGNIASAYSIGLDGLLSDDVRVNARATILPRTAAGGSYSLSQTGLYALAPSLELTARTWQVGVGTTGATLTDLTGYSVGGTGAKASYTGRRISIASFLARPLADQTLIDSLHRSTGVLSGARMEVLVGNAKISTAASHLSEELRDSRRLDAFSVGGTIPTFFNGSLSSEIAARAYEGGSGMGWSADYSRRSAHNSIALRVNNAPGGVSAFAQASSQLQASVTQNIGRADVNAGLYRNADNSREGLSSLASGGWSAGAQLRVNNSLSIGVDSRGFSFDATGVNGSFGSSEASLGGNVKLLGKARYASLAGSVAQASRLTASVAGVRVRDVAPRTSARAAVGGTGYFGQYEASAQLDRSGAGVGFLPRQLGVAIRADRIPVPGIGSSRVFASASAQRTSWFGDRSSATSVRTGLSVIVSPQFQLTVNAERNPFLMAANAGGGWFYTLKLDRRTSLPKISHTTTRGVVFQDRNANGKRDNNEPGMPATLVKRGSESGASSNNGEFEFDGVTADTVSIDPMSLPVGWIVGNAERDGKTWSLAAVAVSAVEIDLALTSDAAARVDSSAFSRIVVMARDDRGRTWLARTNKAGSATFDALPAGHYVIQLDVADIEEPLTPTVDPIGFVVSSGSSTPRVAITLRPRQVKVKMMKPQSAPGLNPETTPQTTPSVTPKSADSDRTSTRTSPAKAARTSTGRAS